MVADCDDAWKGQGLHIEPLEPLRRWRVAFHGKVKKVVDRGVDDDNDLLDVAFDGEWQSDEGIFDYDTDLSPSATARAFAKEEWNEQFFQDLQRLTFKIEIATITF